MGAHTSYLAFVFSKTANGQLRTCSAAATNPLGGGEHDKSNNKVTNVAKGFSIFRASLRRLSRVFLRDCDFALKFSSLYSTKRPHSSMAVSSSASVRVYAIPSACTR